MILYKAIEKYGIDNFEVTILYSEDTKEFNKVKRTLDTLERKYIEEYKSQVPNGYNQTSGGDAGVLGLKMSQEQKETVSKNSSAMQNDGRNMIYCYDIRDKMYYTAVSLPALSLILGVFLNTSQLRYRLTLKRFVLARSKEELEKKIKIVNSSRVGGRFISKFTSEMREDLLQVAKMKDFCLKYKVCKKTYYNYKNNIEKHP